MFSQHDDPIILLNNMNDLIKLYLHNKYKICPAELCMRSRGAVVGSSYSSCGIRGIKVL